MSTHARQQANSRTCCLWGFPSISVALAMIIFLYYIYSFIDMVMVPTLVHFVDMVMVPNLVQSSISHSRSKESCDPDAYYTNGLTWIKLQLLQVLR